MNAKVFDTRRVTAATLNGVITTDPVYLLGAVVQISAGAAFARLRVHPGTDGSPDVADSAYMALASESGESLFASQIFERPIAAWNGLEYDFQTGGGTTGRAHVYFSPMR